MDALKVVAKEIYLRECESSPEERNLYIKFLPSAKVDLEHPASLSQEKFSLSEVPSYHNRKISPDGARKHMDAIVCKTSRISP